jgi:hypothetical protein
MLSEYRGRGSGDLASALDVDEDTGEPATAAADGGGEFDFGGFAFDEDDEAGGDGE